MSREIESTGALDDIATASLLDPPPTELPFDPSKSSKIFCSLFLVSWNQFLLLVAKNTLILMNHLEIFVL